MTQTSQLARSPTEYGGVERRMRQRVGKLWGITVHTTGSGLPKKAGWDGAKALRQGVDYYTKTAKWGGPHYLIGWDGTIVRTLVDENMAGAHAGITNDKSKGLTRKQIVSLYNKGGWERHVSKRGAALWHARWKADSPTGLVPNGNLYGVNDFWLGVEMIPITSGKENHATPAYKGARFTEAQHDAMRELAMDIAARHGWPEDWASAASSRLVGHSDLNPIQRDTESFPLWDPGYHTGAFDMDFVRNVDKVPTKHVIAIGPTKPASSATPESEVTMTVTRLPDEPADEKKKPRDSPDSSEGVAPRRGDFPGEED